MVHTHTISSQNLTLETLEKILLGSTLVLSEEARQKIVRCRDYLDRKIADEAHPLYGVNTGFGSLYTKNIPKEELEKLQDNLVKSHACGTGPEVPEDIVSLMLFLKVQSLSYGYSGVQLQTVERLMEMFNQHVLPRIYEMGSMGASGDLVPLAH